MTTITTVARPDEDHLLTIFIIRSATTGLLHAYGDPKFGLVTGRTIEEILSDLPYSLSVQARLRAGLDPCPLSHPEPEATE